MRKKKVYREWSGGKQRVVQRTKKKETLWERDETKVEPSNDINGSNKKEL